MLAAALVMCGLGIFGVAVFRHAELTAPQPTPILYDRNGTFLMQVGTGQRPTTRGQAYHTEYGYWPLNHVPDRIMRATLALEDRRFESHPGVDPLAALRAGWGNMTGHRRSGASTIAMQIARMQDPAPRSFGAKVFEAGTALALTLRHGREAVLAHYLRLVPYGNGSHGIAHAARFYLDKPVEDLSWAEIALLSAIPQSPTRMNPLYADGMARAKVRGHRILNELSRQNLFDAAELDLAHRQLTAMRPLKPLRRPDATHALLRYEAMLRDGVQKPANVHDPRLRTTLDLPIQQDVTRLARRYLDAWRINGAEQVAVLVVKSDTGEVVASLGSSRYTDRRAGALDFTRVLRSPGSTLKPFIYALALDRKVLRPSDVLGDLPEGASGISNADSLFLGPMLPRQALANSRNVPATNLLRSTGLETTFRFLNGLGLHNIEGPADSFGLSMALGGMPTTLEKLTRAYGIFANDGRLGDLAWFEGETHAAPRRVLSTDSARLITAFLADPMARLPSFPRYSSLEYPFPVAVKTGTSQGYRDAWTVAWSKNYIVGVWIGRGDAGTMAQLSGVRTAARLAKAVMMRMHEARAGDLEDIAFPPPEGREAVELCVFGGKRSNGQCGQTLTEWLRPEEIPALAETMPARAELAPGRNVIDVTVAHRAWAKEEGYAIAAATPAAINVQLHVVSPEHNSHIWLNPDTPQAVNRIALKAVVDPPVPQVVWYVDGEPFAITDPDKPVFWQATPGAHRFQVRLPLQKGASSLVHIVVN